MSVTFKASSNEEAQEASTIFGEEESIEYTLKMLKTWATSFPLEGEEAKPGREMVDESAKSIQASWNAEEMAMPCNNGLVSAVLEAYNEHYNLVLRPDDFWTAIMIQFGFYVTGNSEALRDRLVSFEGKQQLVIVAGGTLMTADFGTIANRMVDEQIAKNIKDPSIVEWVIPSFSTTTENDRIVSSVSLMASLQNFFDYKFVLRCGIPNVTLLGTPQDWEMLRAKVDRLLEFSIEGKNHMEVWHGWLAHICDNLVASANGSPSMDFWDKVACHLGGGSGPSYISGWLSTFAVFNSKGEWQGEKTKFEGKFGQPDVDTGFPVIDTTDLPAGVTSVPVLVDDNGTEYDCFMFAGHIGYKTNEEKDTVIPRTDWCIATKLP